MLTSILQCIGKTPLLKLKLAENLPANIWLKLENRNPAGSIKDRVAFHCIDRAITRGDLKPGRDIVAATSGNMGIGMAMVSMVKGFKCILTMPESMSKERRLLLKGYGAELVLTPANAGMTGAVVEAERIVQESGAWYLDQFSNLDAVAAHYSTTGREIFNDSQGIMDVLVAGVGSGSSITGTGRYLKENIPNFKVVAIEPEESAVLSGKSAGAHAIQGIGAGFIPKALDISLLDDIIIMKSDKAIETARLLMQVDGVCAGISTGANVAGAIEIAMRPEFKNKNIVTFACDTGERYLSANLFA